MVGGWWSVVGGRWFVVDGWWLLVGSLCFVVRGSYFVVVGHWSILEQLLLQDLCRTDLTLEELFKKMKAFGGLWLMVGGL